MQPESSVLPLTTTRLLLRRFAEADWPAYRGYRGLDEVYAYLYRHPPDAAALREAFSKMLAAPFADDGDWLQLAAVRREDDQVLGEVLLKMARREARQAEVGYMFHPRFAGNGYASEAVAAIIGLGFAHFGFHRIFARIDTENRASVALVERLGLRREAHLVENDCFGGRWGSEYVYAVLSPEWTGGERAVV